jgi:uncharacterized protein (TIGR03435 family)
MWRTAAFLACACLTAQDHAEFDVASVKPNTSLGNGISIYTTPGGDLTATNVSLRTLIAFAYDIRDFQITGGPKWMETDRYDIFARPPHSADEPPTSPAARNRLTHLRMKALLADRFQLVVHTETKEMPVYVLAIGKNGPHLSPANSENPQRGINGQRGLMTCTGISMQTFAERALAPRLGNIVLDKTGLSGEFDIKLQYADDSPPKPGVEAPAETSSDPSGPTLAVALQEQLGLKLETQKAPVEVIVVDRAEKASAN